MISESVGPIPRAPEGTAMLSWQDHSKTVSQPSLTRFPDPRKWQDLKEKYFIKYEVKRVAVLFKEVTS